VSYLLSILIPTTPDREQSFTALLNEIYSQIQHNDLDHLVEVEWMLDNKEMSVGAKRDALYKKAQGEYSVQWDSDDYMHEKALPMIVEALRTKPDCVTYKELCLVNGKYMLSNFSLNYDDWHDNPLWPGNYDFARTPFFKTPIRTDLCRQVGVADMRYGEDYDFARRIKPLLKTEVHVNEFIYHYIHNSSEHNERYGIEKDSIA